ncbi:uncharacterized protein LOC133287801 [Gastrolobium bilobum]|uniref:uncharacterized protein LOC133287801 n=1 Tax=Gastrolobium bilobum TaxID=150636 RepID=UPI002AB141F1|nr:uncharacterized protein LOC133287801 [Gastrolobium bilobum]
MAIKRYLMKKHQEAIVVESTPTKLSMKCCAHVQGCPWRIRVIKPMYGENWKVTKWGGNHNCLNDHLSQDHRQLDSNVIAALVVEMIKKEPSVAIALVQERITHSYGFKVSYRKAWYAKQKAMAMLYGDWEESYAFLPSWCEYMLRFSPGSFYNIQTKDCFVARQLVPGKRVFVRCFWTFRQCCEAFKFCKPMIQIDGTHLYGKYKGKLLIATAQDGNNECVSLAFAVVEGETLEAWSYFLANPRQHVTQVQNICLISDRHVSILSAVENNPLWQPPHAFHVFCLRHVASNFNQRFRNDKLKASLMNIGYTPCMVDFERSLARFRDTSSKLVQYCVERGQSACRQLESGHTYCKNVIESLTHNESVATMHTVRTYNVDETIFEVDAGFERTYVVNLIARTCQCGQFKAIKYPCSHAVAAALSIRRNYRQYIDDVFKTSNLVKAYSFPWEPIGNEQAIPPNAGPVVIPDKNMLRAKGRLKSTRIRNEMDEVETITSRRLCGLCKQHRHNRRSCPNRGNNA